MFEPGESQTQYKPDARRKALHIPVTPGTRHRSATFRADLGSAAKYEVISRRCGGGIGRRIGVQDEGATGAIIMTRGSM